MINPKFLTCSINLFKSPSSGINIILIFLDSSIFLIFVLMLFIVLILFSISKISFISLIRPSSFFLISTKFLYLSKDNFILSGNFSISFKKFPLKYKLSYSLSTFNNNSSSLLFNIFLILVNIFCIFNFNSSFFSFICSYFNLISLNDSLNLDDNSSNTLIFSFIPFFFSSIISSIKHISQLACIPYPFPFIFTIHSEQHNLL